MATRRVVPGGEPAKGEPAARGRCSAVTDVLRWSHLYNVATDLLATDLPHKVQDHHHRGPRKQWIATAIVRPKHYFSASNQLSVLTLIVCWTITLFYDYRQVVDHPARVAVGHYNPCFGWDFVPASYVAVCSAGLDVHFSLRYAGLESMRTRLLDADGKTRWNERFAIVTTWLHGAASILWLLLWSVGPPDGKWVEHLVIFTVCVLCRYLCTLGNYLESAYGEQDQRDLVERKHTAHVVIYGCVTAMLPVAYFVDVVVYKTEGRTGMDPFLPWQLLQIMDAAWMLCLATTTTFAVPEPPIHISHRIVRDWKSGRVEELYNVTDHDPTLGADHHDDNDP